MDINLIGLPNINEYFITKDGFGVNTNIMPPLSLAYLTSYLRKNNFKPVQDDLTIKMIYDNTRKKRGGKINLKHIFYDGKFQESMEKYLMNKKIGEEETDKINKLSDTLLKKLNLKKPDLVGFSMYYSMPTRPFVTLTLLLSKKIKEKTGARIVFGGANCDSFGTKMLKNLDAVDFLVSSQGEVPLLKLCEALERGGDLKKVPSLIYKDGKRIKINKTDMTFDFENAPPPDFDGLPMEKYRETHVSNKLVLPYQFIRGCPFRCSFCRFCINTKFVFKSPDRVVSEIEEITKKYGTLYLFFMNNTLNISNKYVEKICENLKGLDILWSDSVRPTGLSKGILTKMRKAGCIRLVHGIESASQRELSYINKDFTVTEAERVIRNAHKAGILNLINFIIGFPNQNEMDMMETMKFIQKNRNFLDVASLFGFALTESDMFYRPENYNIKVSDKFEDEFLDFNYYRYNEIGGLKWEQRQIKMMEFLKMLKQFIIKQGIRALLVDVSKFYRADLTYHLYDQFGSKKKVKEFLESKT